MQGIGLVHDGFLLLLLLSHFFFPCSFLLTHSPLALVLHSCVPSGAFLLHCWSPPQLQCLRSVTLLIKFPFECPPVSPPVFLPVSPAEVPAPCTAILPYPCQDSGARAPLTGHGRVALWVGTDWDQHGAVPNLCHTGRPVPPATKALAVMPVCSSGGR